MPDIKKISQIKLQDVDYAIDVHNNLKAKLDTDTGDNLKVATKGYVDEADTALDTKKLDKAPDGEINLIDDQGKISAHYLHDAILGQMKFGGITSEYYTAGHDVSVHISDLLKCALTQQDFQDPIDDGEFCIRCNHVPTLHEHRINNEGDFVIPEGFYFIANCDIPQENAAADFGITTNIVKGDWLVSVGAVTNYTGNLEQSHKWCKVDNTDAVTSVNGQIGNVTIDTGIITINNVGPDGQGNFNLAAGDNITITEGTNKLTIAATVPEQVQADWNENDVSSPAYVQNRTHYTSYSTEIVHTEDIALAGPPMNIGYTFRDGETYDVRYSDSETDFSDQFTVKPDTDGRGNRYCLIGTFMREPDMGVNIYLYGNGNGEYTELVSHTVDGYTAGNYGMLNIYTTGIKQLDAKYIPVDNETIKIENGKLVGAASSNVDLSNVDQDINVVNGHSVNISGDLNIDGDIAFGNFAATSLKVTNEPTEDDDVVNKAYFDSHSSNVDLSNYTGDVNIDGNVAITGDLSFEGDFEIASLDAQSIKVNGKRVLVEGDATGGSVAGITTGSVENSLEFFDGEASAEYAIAVGTNEKDAIIPIVGSTLASLMNVAAPAASGVGAIAIGGGAEATSAGSLAMGSLNRVGIKGLYYSSIDVANKTITLSTSRSSAQGSNLASTYNWTVGDTVSFVNDSKYPYYTTITAISGNVITVANLPFEQQSDVVTYSAFTALPDDFTIYACYQKTVANVLLAKNIRWYPRDGAVELGWAGTAFGIENLVSGSAGFATGWNNWTAGDFGTTFGRDNISGYAGLAAGLGNTSATDCSTVFGQGNQALRNPVVGEPNGGNLIAGNGNITSAWNAAAIGRQLRATTNAQLVAGQFNAITEERATFVVGNGNVGEEAESGYTGEILDGRKVLRSNAFTVYHSGKIEAGKSTITTDSGKTLVTLDLIKGTGTNVGSNVFSLGVNNTYGHFEGSSVGATTNATESLIVGNGNTAHGNQILVAGYNNKVGVNQGVALGEGNTVTGAQGFAANYKNTVVGASGAAFGDNNTVNGQNSAAFGLRNKVLVTTGISNSGKNNMVSGEDNTSSNWNNAAFGRCLDADTSALTVVGQFNKTPSARAMFIVGNGNVNITGVEQTTTTNQTATAYSRRNAFVAYYDGRCAAGAHPVDDYDLVTLKYFRENGSAKFPETAEDGSALQDGAIMVYRSGKGWIAENPPTTVYTGEVE